MKTPEEIIRKHINWDKTDLRFASVKYFAESGSLSGALHEAIGKCMEEYAKIFYTPLQQVQGKEVQTAEEVLKLHTIAYPFVLTGKSEHNILAAMEQYASQFKTPLQEEQVKNRSQEGEQC